MVSLKTVATVLNGDRSSNYPSKSEFLDYGEPFINAGHLQDGKIDYTNMDYISFEKLSSLSGARIQSGDILLCLRGSLGKYAFVSKDGGAPASSIAVIRANSKVMNPNYLAHVVSSSIFQKQIDVENNGSSQPNLSASSVESFLIPCPDIVEQKHVAEALSDVDELIASLEKLIEKKKAIKQGAMQELLTGKRRLPGFSGEWKTARFGDLFVICPNNTFTREQLTIGGEVKNIHYGDILTKYGEYLDGSTANIPTLEKSLTTKKYPDNAFVQSGDVIIADTAEDLTVGKAVEIVNVCGKMLSGQHTFLCRPIIQFAPMYLGYYINSTDFHDQIVPYVTGTKVSSISRASLCSLIVRYPELSEQEAIAGVLTNLDNSIVALQQRFLKAQQIKQGMMQQLLTGNIQLL